MPAELSFVQPAPTAEFNRDRAPEVRLDRRVLPAWAARGATYEGPWGWPRYRSREHTWQRPPTTAWDPAERLETEEDMAACFNVALGEGDLSLIMATLGDTALARRMKV